MVSQFIVHSHSLTKGSQKLCRQNLTSPVNITGSTISARTHYKTPKNLCITHPEDRPSREPSLSFLLPLAPLASSNLLGRLGTLPSLICFNGGPSPPPPSRSRATGRLELSVSETSICTCKIYQTQMKTQKNRLYKRSTPFFSTNISPETNKLKDDLSYEELGDKLSSQVKHT